MAGGGFTGHTGPAAPPVSKPRFGQDPPRPPPPFTAAPAFPFSSAPRSQTPRSGGGPVAVERVRAPPLVYDGPVLGAASYQSAGVPRRPEVRPRAYESTRPAASPFPQFVGAQRPLQQSLRWVNEQRSFPKDDAQTDAKPSSITSFTASRDAGTSVTVKISRFQDLKRTGSPASQSTYADILRNSSQTFLQRSSDLHVGNGNQLVPPRMRSPPPYSNIDHTIEPPFGRGQGPGLAVQDNVPKLPGNNPNLLARQTLSSDLPYVGSYGFRGNFAKEVADGNAPNKTSLPLISPVNEVVQENSRSVQEKTRRASISPPSLGTKSNTYLTTSNSQIPQRPLSTENNAAAEAAPSRTAGFLAAKRTRSPPLPSSSEAFQSNFNSTQDGTEREMQAKARRLARFKQELDDGFENGLDIAEQKVYASRHEQSIIERQKFTGDNSSEPAGDFSNGNSASDFEGLESSRIIVGLCPDMCPEPERAERERKGDLDQYERLDGDRNQTNKFLAVKKYNRTAEREASLIRPMPILQKTIDYLLSLLDQPYDDSFLSMYNFLWDRMRAIRMDLRMQHIFNQQAIIMLEQMIRLHIIAMHELCEYTKGEGFSEGFDAHLNIEQMNKTSVELFQMYDDHRKKGIDIPTEKEFRGYYALLKLDKHPGYKVEPAELSLDLAKMTSEIRQTPEVLFARDVARACRTGNFIAFFRLARKASYLQACLMHAHFAKLRTQALAFLHAGLQNTQGLPVAHVAKWLAMEEEDIETLLEYHGFLIKEFEEPYMVKEGPFLNSDKDYPTQCSKLVHLKKSRVIVENVSLPAEATKEIQQPKTYKQDMKAVPPALVVQNSINEVDVAMPDCDVASPKIVTQVQPRIEISQIGIQMQPTIEKSIFGKQVQPTIGKPTLGKQVQPTIENLIFGKQTQSDIEKSMLGKQVQPKNEKSKVDQQSPSNISPWGFSSHSSPASQPALRRPAEISNHDSLFRMSPEKMFSGTLGASFSPAFQERSSPLIMALKDSKHKESPDIDQEGETGEIMENHEDEEVAQAKLKLITRLWRRRTAKLRELREKRQIAANAALSSLSLGPPILLTKHESSAASKFDIDLVLRERYEKQKLSWSQINISDVIVDILNRRMPDAKCLCWKIILFTQINGQEEDNLGQGSQVMEVGAGPWLLSKLMPTRKAYDYDNDDLLISSPGLSIWKTWVPNQYSKDFTCCLSVVRDLKLENLDETIVGASAVVFLVSESIPWNLQKIQLHNILMSIPSGSSLPLLVLSGSYNEDISDPSSIIVSELGLHDVDKSRVSSFLVIFLAGDTMKGLDGFYSDMQLREGLQWLASESPLQPDLHCIRVRELILNHLNTLMEVLERRSDYDVSPNHCVSAFNEALDLSLGEIIASVKANPTGWPCPEIALLEDHCDEQMMVNWQLPSIGWSSEARAEPLLCAINSCKLPNFSDNLSWLYKGANTGDEIQLLKSQLENCLTGYLTESCGMMGWPLAAKEAYILLQRNARLELHDSSYYIIPNWIKVFRRIFNWRLMSLSDGTCSSAYVLRHSPVDPDLQIIDELRLEGRVSSPYLHQPSLDEMIDGGCATILSESSQLQAKVYQSLSRMASNGDVLVTSYASDSAEKERTSAQEDSLHVTDDVVGRVTNGLDTSDVGVARSVTKQTDNLSKLLERCNIVQNSIHEKLSIYF